MLNLPIVTVTLLLFVFLDIVPTFGQVFAFFHDRGAPPCPSVGVITPTTDPSPIPEDRSKITIKFPTISDGTYRLRLRAGAIIGGRDVYTAEFTASGGKLSVEVDNSDNKLTSGKHGYTVQRKDESSGNWSDFCGYLEYKVGYEYKDCRIIVRPPQPLRDNEPFAVDVFNAPKGSYPLQLGKILGDRTGRSGVNIGNIDVGSDGKGIPIEVGPITQPQDTELSLYFYDTTRPEIAPGHFCVTALAIRTSRGQPPRDIPPPGPEPGPAGESCQQRAARDPNVTCTTARGGPPCDGGGIPTAIGCIHTQPVTFTRDILRFTVAIAGGIAFLLMVFGTFGMITSAGNPEALEASKDRFTKAIIGLLIIIFAVLLLKIIGVDILGLGGFLGVSR